MSLGEKNGSKTDQNCPKNKFRFKIIDNEIKIKLVRSDLSVTGPARELNGSDLR